MKRFLGGVAAILLLTTFTAKAQTAARTASSMDEVDRYVEEQMRSLHIPGVSLAVVRDGRIVKAKGYGLANIEANYAAAPDTVLRTRVSQQTVHGGSRDDAGRGREAGPR